MSKEILMFGGIEIEKKVAIDLRKQIELENPD